MKKIGTIFLLTFLVFGMIGFVSAEENNSEVNIQNAGSINAFERMMERIQLSFISDPEKKAEKTLEYAEERLAEIEKLTEEGKLEEAAKLQKHYQRMIGKSEKAMERIEANGDINKSQNALRKMARIENQIEKHNEKRDMIHLRLLDKENLTAEEIEEIEDLFGEIENSSESLDELAEARKENFETKLKVLSELSDEELENLLAQIESQEGILEEREERQIRAKERNMREIEVRERNLERIQERIESSNMTEEEKEIALERFEMQKEHFEEFKERKEESKELFEERREEARERFEKAKELREEHNEEMAEAIKEELEERQKDSEEDEVENETEDSEEDEVEEENSTA